MASLDSIMERMRETFVTTEVFNLRFSPVEKIVYGSAGMVLIAFMSAIIVFFIKRSP